MHIYEISLIVQETGKSMMTLSCILMGDYYTPAQGIMGIIGPEGVFKAPIIPMSPRDGV